MGGDSGNFLQGLFTQAAQGAGGGGGGGGNYGSHGAPPGMDIGDLFGFLGGVGGGGTTGGKGGGDSTPPGGGTPTTPGAPTQQAGRLGYDWTGLGSTLPLAGQVAQPNFTTPAPTTNGSYWLDWKQGMPVTIPPGWKPSASSSSSSNKNGKWTDEEVKRWEAQQKAGRGRSQTPRPSPG